MHTTEIKWLSLPEPHDYPAAADYLTLLYESDNVTAVVARLQSPRNTIVQFKAKDIFRASRLSLLGVSNSHVKKNLAKITSGKSLSPLLLVRTDHGVVVADGYHRLCAVYTFDEDALIPCKISSMGSGNCY